MARPSRNIDQRLLQSGRELFPLLGCAGLSLRLLAEHAQVNVGMFHYHFQSKQNFLRVLFQHLYDEMFAQLQEQATDAGSPLQRLGQSLCLLGRLLREHGPWLGQVWSDAGRNEAVACEFLRQNGSRHVALILGLLDEVARQGRLLPMAPMQRFTFLMGAVVAPVVIAPRAIQLGVAPARLREQLKAEVLSDKGIAERVDRALAALIRGKRDARNA